MKLTEFGKQLGVFGTVKLCDEYLSSYFCEVRSLFYGLTRQQLEEQCYDYERYFYGFLNSPAGRSIQNGTTPPESVIALLIFFFSLFERSGLYSPIRDVAELIPPGSLRNRALAIFEYKKINDAAKDYLTRFDKIVGLLHDGLEQSDELAKSCSLYLLEEYAVDALQRPKAAGVDIRRKISKLFQDPAVLSQYPLLRDATVQHIFDLDQGRLVNEGAAIRSHIVETLHNEACLLFPEGFSVEEYEDDDATSDLGQNRVTLPSFLDDILQGMGANFNPQGMMAKTNFDNSTELNRTYLGTYFPRTVIEASNIVYDILHTQNIRDAFAQKDVIRVLDIGSGTGAAVVGTLLALAECGVDKTPVEIISIDFNQDALDKQSEILTSLKPYLSLEFDVRHQRVQLPFDLDGYVEVLSSFTKDKSSSFDLITTWKCLSEFYNVNVAQAQGIVKYTLDIVSKMLSPFGVYVLSDVTTTDNGLEYFSMILNRECNEHDANDDSTMVTIIPMPCAASSTACGNLKCYTQRKFSVNHRLVRNDVSKIAYRVFAPNAFAERVTATYSTSDAFRNNAARPSEACSGCGRKRNGSDFPSGYTGLSARR